MFFLWALAKGLTGRPARAHMNNDDRFMETTQHKVGSKLVVCIHDQNKRCAPVTLESPSDAELRQLNKDGFGIFETANSFFATDDDLKTSGEKTKRQKEFLSQLTEVFADLDVCKEEEKMPENRREELKRNLKAAVDNYCPATFYVLTKNGLHPHWKIDEPNVDGATQTAYTNVIRGIIEWSKQHGSKGDKVSDVTRVLRKPGFFHHKAEPYLVTEELGSGKIYTLDELKNFFWKEDIEKRSELPVTESNYVYKQIDELDIRQVTIAVWKEKGQMASFDQHDRLLIDGVATATFKGRLGNGNYIATTSSDYPARGNAITYVAETLTMTNQQAFSWLCRTFNIDGKKNDVSDELPEPITAADLEREVFSPDIWMIDRLVPENQITVISGAASSFKTMSALEWAIKVTSGGKAYGNFDTLKSSVLFVSEDGDHKRVFQKRIRLLGENFPSNLYLWLNKGFKVTESAVNSLITLVRKHTIKLVIFDSLRGIMPTDLKEIDASDVRQFVNRLRPLTASGATILIIHHDRKKPAGRNYSSKDPNDLGEMMSGSGDIRGAVDCHLSMRSSKDTKEDQDCIVVTQTKCREEEFFPPFRVLVKKETKDNAGKTTKLQLAYDGEYAPDNAEETLIKAKEAILELLSKSDNKYIWRQDIINSKPGDLKQRTLDKALDVMEKSDKAIASKTGKELGKKSSESKRKYYFIDADAADASDIE